MNYQGTGNWKSDSFAYQLSKGKGKFRFELIIKGQEIGNHIHLRTNCPKEKVNSGLSEVSRDRKLEIRFICVPTVQRKR